MSRTEITDVNQKIDLDRLSMCGDFLLVELIEKYKTDSGIILPKGERSAARFARVIRVGWGVDSPRDGRRYPLEYKPGEIVVFMDYAGERVNIRDGKFRIIREHGIWAKAEMDKELNLTKIIPLTDVVMLEFPKEEKSLSGLVNLPGNVQTLCRVGFVVAVGPGYRNNSYGVRLPMHVKPGDKVIAMRYSGANVFIGKKEYRLCNLPDIKCVLEGEGEVDVMTTPRGMETEDPVIREERQSKQQLEDFADRGVISRELIR